MGTSQQGVLETMNRILIAVTCGHLLDRSLAVSCSHASGCFSNQNHTFCELNEKLKKKQNNQEQSLLLGATGIATRNKKLLDQRKVGSTVPRELCLASSSLTRCEKAQHI